MSQSLVMLLQIEGELCAVCSRTSALGYTLLAINIEFDVEFYSWTQNSMWSVFAITVVLVLFISPMMKIGVHLNNVSMVTVQLQQNVGRETAVKLTVI